MSKSVSQFEFTFSEEITRPLVEEVREHKQESSTSTEIDDSIQHFTSAELCLDAYAKCMSIQKVAEVLEMPEDTVRKHLRDERNRLGLINVRELLPTRQDVESVALRETMSDKITQSRLLEMVKQQSYRCAISGLELTPNNAALDHVTAIGDGGSTTVDNIQWLHREINQMKGSMRLDRFIQLCRAVASMNS